ncbi:hypothetical protein QSH57_015968 [Fusarium oxysporum f. sp. vasinfectum]|nr:hypothetical protein QSH57_015968 [Fusarium oxysporum f. sp. vasinfectum]
MTLLSPRVKTAALLLFLRSLQDVPQIAAADAVLFFAADAVDAPVADRPHPGAGAGAGAGRVDDRVQAPVAAPVPYAVREDCLSIRRQPVSVLLFPERNIRVAEASRPPAWIRQANSLLERVDNA